MGRESLRLKRVEVTMDKGYFPNVDFQDIPNGGTNDCKHVIHYRSELRPTFGMDRINSAQASQTRGQGVFYLNVDGATARSFTFGTKFYEDVSGTITDRTGAITITDGENNLVQSVNWQAGANKFAIYCNGNDAPWKWTGSGNAAALGGSPPANFESIAVYNQTVFGSANEITYFSDTDAAETWNATDWQLTFQRNITCQLEHGPKLAVFMRDFTGSVQGFDYLDFTKQTHEITGVGCVGRLAACRLHWGKSDTKAIATISDDGVWLIDEVFGNQKLLGTNFFSDFNKANLHKSIAAYSSEDKLLYLALPKDDTENDYLIVVNTETGAYWPCPDIHANSIRGMAVCKDDSSNSFVYFIDNNGYAFKFNKETKNYHTGTATQAIDSRWKSKKIDLGDVFSMRIPAMLAKSVGDWSVLMYVGFGLTADDGNSGEISQQSDGDVFDSIILDASTLSGSNYVFNTLSGVGGFGRFMQVTITHSAVNEDFRIAKLEFAMKFRRMGIGDL